MGARGRSAAGHVRVRSKASFQAHVGKPDIMVCRSKLSSAGSQLGVIQAHTLVPSAPVSSPQPSAIYGSSPTRLLPAHTRPTRTCPSHSSSHKKSERESGLRNMVLIHEEGVDPAPWAANHVLGFPLQRSTPCAAKKYKGDASYVCPAAAVLAVHQHPDVRTYLKPQSRLPTWSTSVPRVHDGVGPPIPPPPRQSSMRVGVSGRQAHGGGLSARQRPRAPPQLGVPVPSPSREGALP